MMQLVSSIAQVGLSESQNIDPTARRISTVTDALRYTIPSQRPDVKADTASLIGVDILNYLDEIAPLSGQWSGSLAVVPLNVAVILALLHSELNAQDPGFQLSAELSQSQRDLIFRLTNPGQKSSNSALDFKAGWIADLLSQLDGYQSSAGHAASYIVKIPVMNRNS